MILCDASPLVAMVNALDSQHARCVAVLEGLNSEPMLTTWSCMAEAMHLLGRADGFRAQDILWQMIADEDVTIHRSGDTEWMRMRALMRQYQDAPMDLADASLVVAAEVSGIRRIFTLDSHFHIYRIHGTQAFELVA